MEEEAQVVSRRRSRGRIAVLALGLVILLFLLVVWLQRKTIAADYIDRELERRGVQARYEIGRLGVGMQRLENVVIGDPARPDLTARVVEVHLSYGLGAPRVALIRAHGVRMFGRLAGGRVSLGQIDKLLPPPSGAPFSLPDLSIDVSDTALSLRTGAGRVALALEGRGNLASDFAGTMAVRSHRLAFGNCVLVAPAGLLDVSISDRRPSLDGPLRSPHLSCGDALDVRDALLSLDGTLAPALDGWIGRAAVQSAALRSGSSALAGVRGRLSYAGNPARTRGTLVLAAAGGRSGPTTVGPVSVEGAYDVSATRGSFAFAGDASARRLSAPAQALRPLTAALSAAAGSPLEPLANAVSEAALRAGRDVDLSGRIVIANGAGRGGARVERLRATSASGARLFLLGGKGVTYYWPSGALRSDGSFQLGGGGLPTVQASLAQLSPGAPISGVIRMAPFAAGGARLALGDVRLHAAPGGATRIETVATIDGPLPDGRVTGLVLPVRGRFGGGAFAFGEGCTPAAIRALAYSSLQLGPTRLALCPDGPALVWKAPGGDMRGGARVAPLRLAGRLGSSPIALASQQFRFDLVSQSFAGSNVAVRLGQPGGISRLDLAQLGGRIGESGITGTFAGGTGKLAAVPLLLSAGNGRWQVIGGKASVTGALTVADEADPARFYPLATRDLRLTLVGNDISATAALTDPETGTHVTDVTVAHALDSGRGKAVLDVPGLKFDERYQPEELTRLTLGVVALVDANLKGRGEIGWGPEGTTSSGTFSTEKANFAATFGPVTGLTTTIRFSDLLGLETAPGQQADVDQIQAGLDVFGGRVRYQLLPALRVKVEAGNWPFAGGELILEETILDFSQPSEKRLTFRVVGMDAAAFVQQMEFSNISATGTFDGVVPMIFDERGGRIANGHLEARPGGGVVSYIGELTDKQLGTYGKLAFDALKALRYSRLTVDLDGSLDAEFLTRIQLDGIAREPTATPVGGSGISGMVASRALGQLAKIPFEFNIMVRGPFRALIGTMRSLYDPTQLIQSVLPPEWRDQPTTNVPKNTPESVQPAESEDMR